MYYFSKEINIYILIYIICWRWTLKTGISTIATSISIHFYGKYAGEKMPLARNGTPTLSRNRTRNGPDNVRQRIGVVAAFASTGELVTLSRHSLRRRHGMVGPNRGRVADPATPFRRIKRSGLRPDGMLEFMEIQLISANW